MTINKKPWARWLGGLVVAGMVLLPLRGTARADAGSSGTAVHAVDLHLGSAAASRIAMDEPTQAADTEKPTSMDTAAEPAPPPDPNAKPTGKAAKKKAPPPADHDSFAFLSDWPFWVIAGGVIVAVVAGVLIYKNAGSSAPNCNMQFDNAGCFR